MQPAHFNIQKLRWLIAFSLYLFFNPQISTAQQTHRIWLSGQDEATAVNWNFMISGGRNSGYWTQIPVPANWEFHGFGNYTYGYGGDFDKMNKNPEIGFYKQKFNIEDSDRVNTHIRLVFEGAMTDTQVKLNGKIVGKIHQGGYTKFSYDVTEFLQTGINVIEVTVHKNSNNASIQNSERIGDFWMFGGIYRPVYLEILPQKHVKRVAIDADMNGDLKMDVYTSPLSNGDQIVITVLNDEKQIIGKPVYTKVKTSKDQFLVRAKFNAPKQWSHEFPNLYSAKIQLQKGTKILHEYYQKFGFRTFEIRDHDGFYLNGKKLLLKGASIHSFRPDSGRALSKDDILQNVLLMKEMNFNTARPCHYPPDDYFFDVCDSLGLLAFDELPGWKIPLNNKEGTRLVKELVVRDVNHPSIVLWSNGNHMSHNPELDSVFFTWDIQKRRPLKNAAKNEDIFANYSPNFDIVDTRYYPSYDSLKRRLKGKHIVLPNEALHALYDGGGAAGLKEYWDALEASKVGGGLMIWALFDEGIVNTDKGGAIDLNGNSAADGIVGPYGEKEGSFYAIREIWSPIRLLELNESINFNGTVQLQNKFIFTNLNQCKFKWKLQNFTGPNEASAGHRTIVSNKVNVPDTPPGKTTSLKLELPKNWKGYEALEIEAVSPKGDVVLSWRFPLKKKSHFAKKLSPPIKLQLSRDKNNPYTFIAGRIKYKFNENTGSLKEVSVDNKTLPISDLPSIFASNTKDSLSLFSLGKVSVQKHENFYTIKSIGANGFDSFTWIIDQNGTLRLDYSYTLPTGNYHYAGIGMKTNAKAIISKKWLGEGPFRIYNNRTNGGLLDVWDIKNTVNTPGKIWDGPEFEGFFCSMVLGCI
ncbi:glycoside hydrolase family 2 protein [Zobellia amurskyensis]|uniref:beta-galactosidase n=1 Tax=Zobellia amurskyensis TaxID=248905 RepID=A0A7X2ZW21_9FLAO|nr:glycoside hydrolase family 2 TIM barrel-domain containing protein [Zobellia amurskyensis]MUH37404.1 glycoside hydrolase family 2 protein [Zobellia amurskyensis]